METASKGRRTHLGICFAVIYIVTVLAAYLWATIGKPDEFGYVWLPFFILAAPWYRLADQFFVTEPLVPLAIPCFILNAGILFLVGALIGSSIGSREKGSTARR
jgi:hypothetical protein